MLLYVPGLECSTKDAPLHSSILESPTPLPLTWNGKPLQPRSLSRSWKQASWLRRLFGLTLPPSTRDLGVERWIASLADSLASPTASPASAKASKTSAGSGTTSSESFATLVHGAWCSKMSADFFRAEEWVPYSQAFPVSGSLSNGQLFQRERLVLRTAGSESSSWPTPNTMPEAPNGGLDRGGGAIRARTTPQGLGDLAKSFWPTTNAADARTSPDWPRKGGNPTLVMAADRFWPTATVDGMNNRSGISEKAGDGLQTAAKDWQTPSAGNFSKRRQPGQDLREELLLIGQAEQWRTPDAHLLDAKSTVTKFYGRTPSDPQVGLADQAGQWQTPQTSDVSGARPATTERPTGMGLGLNSMVSQWPTPVTPAPHDSENTAGAWRAPRPGYGVELVNAAVAWPTPNARDHKGQDLQSRRGGGELVARHSDREILPLFAPGPSDPRWARYIGAGRIGTWERSVTDDEAGSCPWAPATKPGVRMLVDGMAIVVDESRRDQLRAVGNGVVPLQIAAAIVGLIRRLTA